MTALAARFQTCSRAASVLLIASGAVCALVPASGMAPSGALALALAGLALGLASRPAPGRLGRSAAAVCAAALMGAGVVALIPHRGPSGAFFGRMEPDIAVSLILAGGALTATAAGARRLLLSAHLAALAALLLSLLALSGYADTVKGFFGLAAYRKMPWPAVIMFNLLCLGILFARPNEGLMKHVTSDGAGGVMARRLLPASLLIPLLLGVLALQGHRVRVFNATFGISLLVVSSIVMFAILTWLTYRALDRSDRERLRLAAILLEEAERRHLARELHDEIGQSLTALKLRLELLARASPDPAPVAPAQALCDDLLSRVQSLSLDLRPAMLDDLGLLPALLWLFERYQGQTGVAVHFEHAGLDRRFAREVETAAFRIAQEALTNVARHAGVGEVSVRAWARNGTLGLAIEDRGCGFVPAAAFESGASSGLSGMRERAALVGGQLTVESAPGAGARLSAEMPLREDR